MQGVYDGIHRFIYGERERGFVGHGAFRAYRICMVYWVGFPGVVHRSLIFTRQPKGSCHRRQAPGTAWDVPGEPMSTLSPISPKPYLG